MWQRTRGLEYRNSFGATSGIWKTTDGGDTWTELTNGLMAGEEVGRIGLTLCKSQPDVLYAFYDLPYPEVAVFKTEDGGNSWTQTNDDELEGMNSSFGWYFGQIRVDPIDPYSVFVMGVHMYASHTGGQSWFDISEDIHVDHHAMIIDETTSDIILGNDGGLYFSDSYGNSWSKINNLPITQFYAIDIDYQHPERIYGGTQDNNTVRTMTGAVDDWEAILGGDGMYTLVDYSNSNVIYAEYQWGNLFRSDNGGNNMNYIGEAWEDDRINWSAPLAMHPQDPETLYFGTYRIWKTENRGNSWIPVSDDLTKGVDQYFHTLTTIAISPHDPSIVIVGAGDGKVHISTNNGLTWTDITTSLPDRWVTRVAADPFDDQTIYATLSGFRWDEPLPHVFKSTNLGQTWTDISGNLPEFPVNAIALDPDIPGKIIVATDAGLYGTIDGGISWEWIWNDIPAVPIYDLKIHTPTRTIVAGTYGLSMYSASLDDILTGAETMHASSLLTGRLTIAPNPVTASSEIRFSLHDAGNIRLSVMDMTGKRYVEFGEYLNKGTHSIGLNEIMDAEHLAPGVYLVNIDGESIRFSGKMVVTW